MFGMVESMAAAHVVRIGADVVERVQAYRIWARLTLQSIPIAFEKGCYAHMAFHSTEWVRTRSAASRL